MGEDLQRKLEQYQGITVELHTDTGFYFQGQQIDLYYRITCSEPRYRPWSNFGFLNWIELKRNGNDLSRLRSNIGDYFSGRELATEFNDMLSINGTFYDVQTRDEYGFNHLLPGNYVGYFDCGIVSPDFYFTVLPVPDTLQVYWQKYCSLRRFKKDHTFAENDPILDSARHVMQEFAVLPEGTFYRKEVLEEGLFTFELYSTQYSLNNNDLNQLHYYLKELANEPRMSAMSIVEVAVATFCKGRSPEATADALLDFARWLGKPAILQEAQKRAEQLRTKGGR